MAHASQHQPWRSAAAVVLPALLLVALAWGAVVAFMDHDFANAVNGAQRQNANLALAFEEYSLGTIRSVDQALQFIAREYQEHGKVDPQSFAGPGRARPDLLITVSITDAAGQVIVGNTSGGPVSYSDRGYFAHHRDHEGGGLIVSAPVAGRIADRTIIPMSRRIDRPDGGFAGVVVAGVDPAYFGEFFRKMELGRDGMVQLVGLDGATRARRTGTLKTSGKANRHSTLLAQQAIAESGNFVSEGRLEGIRRYTSYRTLREFPLVVAVGTSEEEVLAEYHARRNSYLAGAALFSLVVVMFAAFALTSTQRRRHFVDLSHPQERVTAEEVASALVRDPRGRPDYFVAMVQDIGERKAEEKVLHQAQFDSLTDLPNRALFADRLAQALRQARRQRWNACVMFVDLDRFKAVNDTLGHAAGDAALRELARRLAGSVRASDTVARIGGDEFAVVLAQLTQPQDAAVVAEKILKAMAAPLLLDGHDHTVTVSIGIALFPDHGEDEDTLVRHADAAMFESKHAGRNAFRIYDPALAAHAA
jgi:diguanylate cyclase (GGDEF)-like protein